jgi:hypothetical protein
MSGFKFSDLIKPGEGARLALESELRRRRDAWSRPGYLYRGAGDFLLQHGRYYGQPIRFADDDWYQGLAGNGGPYGTCFANAVEYAEQFGVRYCEGVYSMVGAFQAHAWCLNDADEVIEVTHLDYVARGQRPGDLYGHEWQPAERWGYYGVTFRPEFVRWHAENPGLLDGTPTYCILDRSPHEAHDRAAHMLGAEGFQDVHDFPVLKVPYDPERTSL